MDVLRVLRNFPTNYTIFVDFLHKNNFDPKFLKVHINGVKLAHRAEKETKSNQNIAIRLYASIYCSLR